MKHVRHVVAAVVAAAVASSGLVGCPPTRVAIQPTIDDAAGVDVADDCYAFCQKLKANGCPAGSRVTCAASCREDRAQGVGAVLPVQCILAAGTVAAMTACGGGVACP
jgi:hypothetical protein